MPTPSLLIVPARWKTGTPGKLYSQIPTNGDGDFNVTGVITGATNAGTRVNNLGYIEPITTSGTPRLDYYTSSGLPGCPALLIEPSATNLLLRSEQFDVSGTWSQNLGGTGLLPAVTANSVISPDGGQTAETIVFNRGAGNTINDRSFLEQSFTIPTTGTYTFSVYAKASAAGDVGKQIFIRLGAGGSLIAITLTANWTRYSRVETSVASGSQAVQIGNRGTITADNSVSVDLWGAQLETGSVATSYIPTTTAAVTRNADVISVSGAVSGCIGQTEGTIYAEVDIRNLTTADFVRIVSLATTANSNNFFEVEKRSSTQLRITARLNSGTSIVFLTHPNAFLLGTNKIAFAYQDGNYAMALNGVVTTSSQSGMTSSLNSVTLGATSANAAQLNDRIRAAALYTTRLTNDQLMLLTMPGNNTYLPQAVWDNYLSRPGNDEVPDCLYTRHADLLDV